MFFGFTPYCWASRLALSGWPLTRAVTLDFSHFAKAGRISCMERLPSPTMAHPNFLSVESGTAISFAAASFKKLPATLAATKPWPTFAINPRREISFPKESFMISSSTWDCAVSEFLPGASSNTLYTPAAALDQQAWNIFHATCTSFRQISSSSIHHECGFRPRDRERLSPAVAERSTHPRGHRQPDHPASRSRHRCAPEYRFPSA